MTQHPLVATWLTAIDDLAVVLTTDPVVDGTSNMCVFSVRDAQQQNVSVDEIDFFLLEACRRLSRTVEAQNAWFYAWYDEMSGTLRCSVVDIPDISRLPFRCQVAAVTIPTSVSTSVVAAKDPGFIRFEDLVEQPWEDGAFDDTVPEHVLTVFTRRL